MGAAREKGKLARDTARTGKVAAVTAVAERVSSAVLLWNRSMARCGLAVSRKRGERPGHLCAPAGFARVNGLSLVELVLNDRSGLVLFR